jgi:PAS domain-containing protein
MFDDEDRFTGFRGFSRDITQRVQARRDIRRSEAQLQAIMDNASIGIATINNQGILQSFNPEAQAIFGLSEADVLGKNVSMLMGDADASNHDN